MILHQDCRHFKGDIPCRPHKEHGVHCGGCTYYEKTGERILIVKLGAIGDVIRTTPLIHRLRKVYPDAEITWLTYFPEAVPDVVDRVLTFELKNVLPLTLDHFDIFYNLDKDREACALASNISADIKEGFSLSKGKCVPLNKKAKHKWLTGLFDDENRANRKSYPWEIFETCGFEFNGERYIIDVSSSFSWEIDQPKPLVGLNTGCGKRWITRLWSIESWIDLVNRLKESRYGVVLLGGPDEDARNRKIAEETGIAYVGYFPFKQFVSLMNQCNLVVTGVTMALHVAIGLSKKIVLFNNIFNRNEFELYGLGKIIEPNVTCKGCFKFQFDSECEVPNCMEMITPQQVFTAIKEVL